MAILQYKYRGALEYHLIYTELINAARYRGTVTYQEIAQIMGLPLQGNHMGKEVGYILGEISEDEVTQGRPMLSAVAVGVSGEPGDGFYGFAKDLGLFSEGSLESKRRFWKQERDRVYKAWQVKLHVNHSEKSVENESL